MTKLEKAKAIIKKYFKYGDCGIYDSRNIVGDQMINLYDDSDLAIDICYNYSYFEVFGLSNKEFAELCEYYNQLS